MKLFPGKQKPKQPKGRTWALSRVLCKSNKNKTKAPPPPPLPTTVATRRTQSARTKSGTRKKKNSLRTQLLARHETDTKVDKNDWVAQLAPFDELMANHATHSRKSMPSVTMNQKAANPKRNEKEVRAIIPSSVREQRATLKSCQDSKKSHGTDSCTISLLDDTTLDSSFSSGDGSSTMLDTTATATNQLGCDDGNNRELSLFLCGQILDHAGLRTPEDTQQQKEAWDELILDLLLA
ncbi:MAG: hypothetical protein SGBAC_012319 [Bacillariaceae sp.]